MDALGLFVKGLVMVEFTAAAAGILTRQKWKGHYLQWFPVYLSAIVLLELLFYYVYKTNPSVATNTIKQAQPVVEMLFLHFFFFKALHPKYKKMVITGAVVYSTALVLENTLLQTNTYYFQSLAYTTGNLFILIYLILFFIALVNSEQLLVFKHLTVFWIMCGLMVFYLGSFPFYGLYNELARNLNIFIPAAWIATSLNYCMYLLFTIGFIWGKPH